MDRKLRLVQPAPQADPSRTPAEDDADMLGEVTDEERAAAEALREALDHGADPLAAELRAAHAPTAIGDADLDALVARALGEADASTNAEREAAENLRAELDGEAPVREAAVLVQLRVAASPPALSPETNERLIQAAFFRARRKGGAVRRIAPITMAAVTGIAALAAGFALFFGQASMNAPASSAAAALIRTRSTQELFDAATPFPRSGEESARVDRIAAARASDLRANRFAAWGVR
jgi:hypothetical protein